MPSPQQEKLMGLMAAETGPISAQELAKKAGIPNPETVRTQLVRLGELASKDAQGEWTLTEAGREQLYRPTQESAGTSEYEIFKSLGRTIGVTAELIGVIAEHVWNGGDYEDVDWVWKALGQMDIRADQRRRWWHAWRSHLGKAIPPDLKEEMAPKGDPGEGSDGGAASKGGRDYIIVDDMPVFCGEGYGDMSMKDAKDVIGMRALKARVAASQGGSSSQPFTPNDMLDIIDRINAGRGEVSRPKSYVVTPTPEGTRVEEIEEGKPIVVGAASPAPPSSYLVDHEGNVSELAPGQPIVVKPPTNTPPTSDTYIVQPDATVKKLAPGEPVVIKVQSSPQGATSLPVQIHDKDGNPVVMDLESLINWRRFLGEEQRADDKQSVLKGLVGEIREQLPVALAALKATAEGYNRGAVSTSAAESTPPSSAIAVTCSNCQQPFTLNEIPAEDFPCPHCSAILKPPVT